MFRFVLALVCLFAAAFYVAAQCRDGSCLTPAAAGHYVQRGSDLIWVPAGSPAIAATPTTSADGWFRHEDGHIELWRGGKLIEHAAPAGEKWEATLARVPLYAQQILGLTPAPPRPNVEASSPLEAQSSKLESSKPETFAGDDPFPGGVDRRKIAQAAAYEINGQPATRASAIRILEAGLEDDRGKWFLTAVLPEDQRKQFLADVAQSPALAPWRGKLHVNAYAPADWHVSQIGLADGVSYQGPPDAQGRSPIRFRFRAYTGPEALAQALRDADKNYRPDADPDPSKPKPKTPDSNTPHDGGLNDDQAAGLGLGGLSFLSIGLLVLRRRLGI